MTPKGRKSPEGETRRKTSLVLPESLWIRLKVAAAEERTDVSALLCRLAEEYLKARRGSKR